MYNLCVGERSLAPYFVQKYEKKQNKVLSAASNCLFCPQIAKNVKFT